MSVSFGVSAAEGEDIELDRMLEAADTALLAAKRSGRDRGPAPAGNGRAAVRPARRRRSAGSATAMHQRGCGNCVPTKRSHIRSDSSLRWRITTWAEAVTL